MGNAPNVAREHYLTVTKEHCRKPVEEDESLTGDKLGMQTPAQPRKDAQKKSRTPREVRENVTLSEVVAILGNGRVAGTGFEPATSRL